MRVGVSVAEQYTGENYKFRLSRTHQTNAWEFTITDIFSPYVNVEQFL